MIWRLQNFKKMLKEAYKGAGLIVAKRGTEYVLAKEWSWAMTFNEFIFEKEYKAAVIELAGDLPEAGEILKAMKDEPVQHELPVSKWIMDGLPEKTCESDITQVAIRGYRVVRGGQHLHMVNESHISAIDKEGEENEKGEIGASGLMLDEARHIGCFYTNLSTFKFRIDADVRDLDQELLINLENADWEIEQEV